MRMARPRKDDKKKSRTIQLSDEKYQRILDDATSKGVSFSQEIEDRLEYYDVHNLTAEALRERRQQLDAERDRVDQLIQLYGVDYDHSEEDRDTRATIRRFLEFMVHNAQGRYRPQHWHDVTFRKIVGTYLKEKIVTPTLPTEKAWQIAQHAWEGIWFRMEDDQDYRGELMRRRYSFAIDPATGANYRAYIDPRITKKIKRLPQMYEDHPERVGDDSKIK
jgi:hypothetical protein